MSRFPRSVVLALGVHLVSALVPVGLTIKRDQAWPTVGKEDVPADAQGAGF